VPARAPARRDVVNGERRAGDRWGGSEGGGEEEDGEGEDIGGSDGMGESLRVVEEKVMM
jgi:hypothetical protein